MKTEPREHTIDEMQELFIKGVWNRIKYCENEDRRSSVKEKLELLAFCILSMMDGCSELPAHYIIPRPHKNDKEFDIENGDNYYPYIEESQVKGDIGPLHEMFYKFEPQPPIVSAVLIKEKETQE